MNLLELDSALPNPHFHFNEAYEWIGREVYLKNIGKFGLMEEMKYSDLGYDLLVVCDGFSVLLSKPNFVKWVELKPDQIKFPVMH